MSQQQIQRDALKLVEFGIACTAITAQVVALMVAMVVYW